MKQKLLFGASMVAMLMVGCTNDLNEGIFASSEDALSIEIEGRINQAYITRVDDDGFCDGDQIGLFGVNYTDNNSVAGKLLDEGNQVDNARYTFDEASWTWKSQGGVYYKDAKTNIDLYGYYPYGSPESVSAYVFKVEQDQSGGNAIDGYAMSDFLWGKTENVTPSENKVKIKFNHRMACANVILAEGEGFESGEFDRLKKNVLVMNTTRTSTIDLSTGEVTPVGDAPLEGIVMKSNAEGFLAIVVPQSVKAGKALFSITVDGTVYRFKKDVDFTYQAGKQSKFTIKINKKKHSGEYEFILTDTEIIDWVADLDTHGGEARQYYVVHCEEPGTLEDKLSEAKKDPNKIKNLKVSGKICETDFLFMRSMEALSAVNLKEAEIVNYWSIDVTFEGEDVSKYIAFGGEMPEDENVRRAAVLNRYPNKTVTKWGDTYYNSNAANTIPRQAFFSKNLINFSFPEKVTRIEDAAFSFCTLLSGALIIPDDVTEIGASAFEQCSNLTSLVLPINLKEIGNKAFYQCHGLSGTLNIPETVTTIGERAFCECRGFTGPLVLPERLTVLGERAFERCSGFTGDLKIPEGITTIRPCTFYWCSGLNGRLILHDNLTFDESIQSHQFSQCSFQGELKLPANLKKIPKNCFAYNYFSSIAGFPDGLLEIDTEAFYGCSRLSGVLEFPESLVLLAHGAFEGCINLEGIVLPPDLGLLNTDAFAGCYHINKIVCKSLEPPTISSSTFYGVAKDNFVLEVPEKSINKYQSDKYWGEFKRIGAHHDFSIQRRQMRVLNAEHSRTLVLRAPSGQAWSVESKPEWVTVTPSSGVGKTEVTITVAEMDAGDVGTFTVASQKENSTAMEYTDYNGRGGEVVFLLNDKDYRSTLKVEQYDCDHYDGEVIVNQIATKGGGVNIVFMGDCFDAQDIATGKYLAGVEEAIGHYFDIEPYKTYRNYFNVYTIFGMSNESGMGTADIIRDAKFGSQYSLSGIAPNHATCYEYAMKTETVNESNLGQTLVVLVENTTIYGGITYQWADGSAIACCPMSDDAYPYDFRGVVQHEAGGHGFAKLADECIYHAAFISACGCFDGCPHIDQFNNGKAMGWYRNLEATGDMDLVGWSHLIFHPKYSNIVDMYEGGYYHSRGIFRSEPNSCMNNNIPYYSAISRQEIVERIKRYAGEEFDINEFHANDVLDMQGNITRATRSVEENVITLIGAGKQMPPKFMGDKPQLKKSNK